MTEWHFPHQERRHALAGILLVVLLLGGGPLFALEGTIPSGAVRHEVIPLSHIGPERGREFLVRLKIGTASQLPGTNTLLVTGDPGELQKAVAILGIVDNRTEFDIRRLGPAWDARKMPSNQQIADAVGGISIGTFANPPRDNTKKRGIIDVHNGAVVVIAPVALLADIQTAVESGPEVLKQRRALAGPSNPPSTAPTIQAVAMADPAAAAAGGAGKPSSSLNDERLPSPAEMQARLEEMRRRALELKAQQQAAQLAAQPAAPAPAANPPQVDGNVPPVDPNAGRTTEPLPGGLRQVGAPPQEEGGPEKPAEPVAGATPGLRPGEVVPAQPGAQPQSSTAPAGPSQPAAKPAPASTTAQSAVQRTYTAPDLYEPSVIPNGDEPVNLTLPEKMPVINLLDLMGKYLNLSYVYDPAKVTGEVTLKLNGELRGAMKVRDLYLLLESVLQSKELVMTRHKGNIIRVVPKSEYLNLDPEIVGPNAPPPEAGDVLVARVFELQYVETSSVENFLQGMGLAVGVTSIADKKMVIVTAYAHRMDRIERLLELVDRPGEPREFQYRQLKYTMAKTLAEKVKALAEQLESVTVTLGEPETPTANVAKLPNESDAAYRTRLVQIRAIQAQAARNRNLSATRTEPEKTGVYLDADERTNRILMIGLKKQLEVVSGLVDSLDVEQQELRSLKLYRIKHVDADEAARKLQELGIISKMPETYASQRITSGRYPYQGQTPGQPLRPTTAPTPEVPTPAGMELTKEGLVEEPQVVVVESTNSLLANATAEQHAKIAQILQYVDSEMDETEIPYKVYPLENSSPNHLAELLEGLIQETVEQQKEGGKIEKTVVSRDEKIKIMPDPNTYSLIVYGNKKNQEWISSLIEKLDKRRPQVLIDCTLVEVTKNDAFNYDLQLTKRFNGGSIVDSNNVGKFISSISGTLTAFYADKEITALLNTMQAKSYGRVLAKPKLLVNDNEKGKIETKDTTYVQVSSSIPVNTGAAGTQTNLVQTSVNFNPYEAGIMLDITPHISEGDLLRLDISLTRSDFLKTASVVGPNQQQPPPNTRSNTVDTGVTLPNGSTVILGGLMKMNATKGGSKVPILGDLPLIGGLFRTINNEDVQSKLYVFVKAEIIRPAAMLDGHGFSGLEKLSERNRMAFERDELEFQQYQDWPGIKPKPVDPPKVLEAQ
jgi:general secretion pathway protein D